MLGFKKNSFFPKRKKTATIIESLFLYVCSVNCATTNIVKETSLQASVLNTSSCELVCTTLHHSD